MRVEGGYYDESLFDQTWCIARNMVKVNETKLWCGVCSNAGLSDKTWTLPRCTTVATRGVINEFRVKDGVSTTNTKIINAPATCITDHA
eukprot:m.240816 g.240816  ORF g.240816 m.240816 type:complete len:89 (-) comp15316_c0_seq1:175-441(-)